MAYALQTTVLSLPALRRLRFPDKSGRSTPERDGAGHLVLAALALAAIANQRRLGYDLRSRCLLIPEVHPAYEVVTTATEVEQYTLTSEESSKILAGAIQLVRKAGLRWEEEPVLLKPKPALVELVKKSRQLAPSGEEV